MIILGEREFVKRDDATRHLIGIGCEGACAYDGGIGVSRVSTRRQATDGFSLSDQAAEIRELPANYLTYLESEIVELVGSARFVQKTMLALGKRSVAENKFLVFSPANRFTRQEWPEIERHLVNLPLTIVVIEGGRIVPPALVRSAVYEMASHSRVVKRSLDRVKRGGATLGQAPYGYEFYEGKRIEHSEEFPIRERILELGRLKTSAREIARILNAERLPARNAKQWNHKTVLSILASSTLGVGMEHPD